MKYSHIGWIPCISGHLDFGLIFPVINGSFTNEELVDNKVTCVTYGYLKQNNHHARRILMQNNHHARRILMQSKVDWKDSINNDLDGKFRVIVCAEANDNDNLNHRELTGKVYIYPLDSEPKTLDGKIDLPWFDTLHAAKNSLELYKSLQPWEKATEWDKTREDLNQKYSEINNQLRSKQHLNEHFYEVSFTVNARGFTKLVLNSSGKDHETDKNDSYVVPRQAYYYLKYALHSHKHHYSKEDSLTTIIPYCDSFQETDVIGLKLLGQLKRELTNLKRTNAATGQTSPGDDKGILAYMNSLCVSAQVDNKYLTQETFKAECEYINSLKDSCTVQADKGKSREAHEQQIKSNYRVILGMLFSIIGLFALLLRNYVSVADSQKFATNANLFSSSVVFLTIISFSIWLYKAAVVRKIDRTFESKNLKTWIEINVATDEANYKKAKLRKYINGLKAALKVACTVAIVLSTCFSLQRLLF